MKIALVYNLKKDPVTEQVPLDYYSEFDSIDTIDAIAGAIARNGYEVCLIEADRNIIKRINQAKPDIVFNIAEGLHGTNRESEIPAILDSLGVPYTGSGVNALALALNKALAKSLFIQHEIPTPSFQVFNDTKTPIRSDLRFPMIVKPNCEGSGKGITTDSVVHDRAQLYEQISRIIMTYKQDVLVEEFIEGKELTVAVIGNGDFIELPILEIDFSDCKESGEYFYSWRMKEYQGNRDMGLIPKFYCPARIDDSALVAKINAIARSAHTALGCNDISRVDIRLSQDARAYVLEVNPLPGLDPTESNLPIITTAGGIGYERLVATIVELAIKRYKDMASKERLESAITATYSKVDESPALNREKGGKDVIKQQPV